MKFKYMFLSLIFNYISDDENLSESSSANKPLLIHPDFHIVQRREKYICLREKFLDYIKNSEFESLYKIDKEGSMVTSYNEDSVVNTVWLISNFLGKFGWELVSLPNRSTEFEPNSQFDEMILFYKKKSLF